MCIGEFFSGHRMLEGFPGEFSAVQWDILGVSTLKFIMLNLNILDVGRVIFRGKPCRIHDFFGANYTENTKRLPGAFRLPLGQIRCRDRRDHERLGWPRHERRLGGHRRTKWQQGFAHCCTEWASGWNFTWLKCGILFWFVGGKVEPLQDETHNALISRYTDAQVCMMAWVYHII